jgi:hypothetical protein
MTRWGKGEVSAESIGQRHFWWSRGRETLNRPIPGRLAALWTKTGLNWVKTLLREAGWSICGVEIGEAKRKFWSEGTLWKGSQ